MPDELKTIMDNAIMDSIYRPPTRDVEPRTALRFWRVFEVTFPDGRISTHFVGDTGREGRVSSAIERYFPETRVGTSRSGRHYDLSKGGPGWTKDADWVWGIWCKRNNCTFIEITEKYTNAYED